MTDSVSEVEVDVVADGEPVPTDELETSTETQPTEAEINEAIQAEFNARLAASQQQQRQISFQSFFEEGVALVASATGKRFRTGVPSVSEATAVKIMELTMMWLLNHRNQPTPEFIGNGSEGSEVEEAPLDPYIPNEVIGGDAGEETN